MSAAETAPMQPDAVTIQEWCDFWFHHCMSGEIQIGWRDAETGKLNRFHSFSIGDESIGEFVAAVNAVPGQSCYVRAATVREGLGNRAAEDADFVSAPGVWGDLDDADAYGRAAKVATIIRPSAWVETGRVPHWRGQCFWRMDAPCTDAATIEALNKRVVFLYGGDPSVTNPTRLMRLPGTIAWPVKEGRVQEMTRLVIPPGRPASHTLAFLEANLPREAKAEGKKQEWKQADTGGVTVEAALRRALAGDHWHDNMLRLVAHWVGRGWSDVEILAVADHVVLPGYSLAQTRAELAVMIRGAREKWGVENHDHTIGGDGPAAPFEGEPFDPWDTLRAPVFPMDALPLVLRAFVASRARAIGCDPAAVGMAALSALSAAMDGRWRLRLKQHDGWAVPPALWVALVGPSSAKKSPAIRAAWRHLEELQNRTLRVWAAQVAEWENTPKDMREGKPPSPPRFVTHDATMEALQGILSNQDRGCGVLRDELAGFIGQMDKYSGGRGGAADRAFWLQAFDGGSFVADRVGRGTVAVENLLVSLCGGIQPDRLASFGDLTDDGLWQRFLPVVMAPATMGEDIAAGDEEAAYDSLIEQALRAPAMVMRLSETARPIREDAERRLFDIERSDAFGAHFSSFVGKLSGIWGRLALVLEIADGNELGWVGREAAERASRLVFDYLIPSAARVYATISVASGKGEPVKDAAGYILTKKLPRLLASDLTRNVRACRGMSVAEIAETVSPLVAGGWLAPERIHGGNNSWLVNPNVHTMFAERAERETTRRRQAAELIQASQERKGA